MSKFFGSIKYAFCKIVAYEFFYPTQIACVRIQIVQVVGVSTIFLKQKQYKGNNLESHLHQLKYKRSRSLVVS